jgi:hypothetical protein
LAAVVVSCNTSPDAHAEPLRHHRLNYCAATSNRCAEPLRRLSLSDAGSAHQSTRRNTQTRHQCAWSGRRSEGGVAWGTGRGIARCSSRGTQRAVGSAPSHTTQRPSALHYRTAARPRSLPPRAGPSVSVRTARRTRRAARSRREEGEGGSHRTQGERGRGRSSMRVGEATPARPSDTFPC